MIDKPIYLDYNATTPLDKEVVNAMLPYLHEHFGNPSSSHYYGRRTRQAVDHARQQVAVLLGCHPGEVVFTASGTESNNTVIKGVVSSYSGNKPHIITSAIEHPAILKPCAMLAERGVDVTILPVDTYGRINPDDIAAAITPQTVLISVMLANNEIGTLQPVQAISDIAREHGILVHTDAAQAVGKIPVKVDDLGIDLLSVAGHKFYAPKGVGVLYIREGVALPVFMHGASHEGGRRAGTENVLEIVGLGQAAEVAERDLSPNARHMAALRDQLQQFLTDGLDKVRVNGHPEYRLPNTLSISFRDVQANRLLDSIGDAVAASAGAACHSDQITISSVLEAIQAPTEYAMGTLRLTVGKMTTEQEIIQAAQVIQTKVKELRNEG